MIEPEGTMKGMCSKLSALSMSSQRMRDLQALTLSFWESGHKSKAT